MVREEPTIIRRWGDQARSGASVPGPRRGLPTRSTASSLPQRRPVPERGAANNGGVTARAGIIPPRPAGRRRPGVWGRPRRRATRPGGGPGGGRWCAPGPPGGAWVGKGREPSSPSNSPCSSARVPARPSERRTEEPTGKPVRYHPACLRNWRTPRSSPNVWTSSSTWARIMATISASPGGGDTGRPANASARSRKSQGRPRQPRPTTTPSHPVAATMARASDASHTSPLPRTGMVVTARLSSAMARQSASPEYSCSAVRA